MNSTLPLLAALLLAPLAALRAGATPISHRVLCTDYKGNRVAILSAKGDIEWEFPAKTPQDCWLLPNGNVLFSQKTVSQIAENEIPGNPLRSHRLPNGNTAIGNYLGHGFEGKQPMVFEVTPDKKVVWQFADHARFKTVCQVQIIDTPADPLKGEVLR